MKALFTGLLLLVTGVAVNFGYGQNLIPNPSFETVSSPPCNWLTSAFQFNNSMGSWTCPSNGSTDIFSTTVSTTCYAHPMSTHGSSNGNQMPRTGNTMSAILTYGAGCGSQPNYREYVQTPLTAALVPGQSYDFEFYVSLLDRCRYATDNIQLHFRTASYFQSTCFVMNLTPHYSHPTVVTNTTGWTLISGTITATSAWNHVIIGNFSSNAATTAVNRGGTSNNTRYFIDDVVLEPATILPTTAISLNAERQDAGTVALEWEMNGAELPLEYRLQRSGDGNTWTTLTQTDMQAFMDEFPPEGELQYRVRYKDANGEQFTSEVVRITPGTFPYRIEVAPQPVPAGQPIALRTAHGDDEPAMIELFDLQGRKIWETSGLTVRDLEGYQTERGFDAGIYILRVSTGKGTHAQRVYVKQ